MSRYCMSSRIKHLNKSESVWLIITPGYFWVQAALQLICSTFLFSKCYILDWGCDNLSGWGTAVSSFLSFHTWLLEILHCQHDNPELNLYTEREDDKHLLDTTQWPLHQGKKLPGAFRALRWTLKEEWQVTCQPCTSHRVLSARKIQNETDWSLTSLASHSPMPLLCLWGHVIVPNGCLCMLVCDGWKEVLWVWVVQKKIKPLARWEDATLEGKWKYSLLEEKQALGWGEKRQSWQSG